MVREHNFPDLKNDLIIRAAWGKRTEKVPVWVMRQAGRYLPEFQDFRKKYSFFEICQNPNLACTVTLQPLKRFDLDAAIIFSDILVIPQALGMEVEMKPGVGPVLPNPLKTRDDLFKLTYPLDVHEKLGYVFEAITLTRHQLAGKVPLIGFSGAPWTLMCYMVEGGGSKTMPLARTWLYMQPDESRILIQLLTNVIVDYLVGQIKAGAQLLQVFESNAEFLTPFTFKKFCLPYLKNIKSRVNEQAEKENLPKVPMILFVKGGGTFLSSIAECGYEVVSLDWTVAPEVARQILPETTTLQGNLDPVALKQDSFRIERAVASLLKTFGTQRYIANLGHGIYPDTNPAGVEAFVKSVHELSSQINKIEQERTSNE